MLRWLTSGESHGPALVALMEGLPAGVTVTSDDLAGALARRRLGFGRGARMAFERDEVEFLGGVRHGRTLGGPIAIRIGNSEWPKWQTVMSPDPVDPRAYAAADDVNAEKEIARNKPLTRPRPGHADLVGMQKYGFDDARPILERASARETAARVALGEVAARFLEQAYGIRLVSHTVAIGEAEASEDAPLPTPDDVATLDADPVRTLDPAGSAAMVAEVEAAKKDGDTLGGVVEVLAYGVPPGLGSHVHWDRRLDAQLAGALMGIQAIKGVEIGDGFRTATSAGLRGPRRDGARSRRRHPPAHRAGRWHRGRHVDRSGPAGPRGDEADLHGARGLSTPSISPPTSREGHPPAQRRVRGAGRRRRRRGDGRPRPGRRLPGEVRRETASAETARNHAAYLAAIPETDAHLEPNEPRVVLVGFTRVG
jgi:chorismate synthase